MTFNKLVQIFALMLVCSQCYAGVEYKKFNDPKKEQAYKILIDELRCLVCQNQTIADSNADLAKDLRRQVYEMLEQGKSQDEIVEFMIQRYGDFVMYNPPFKAKTSLLWIGPFVFLVIGLILLVVLSRRKKLQDKPIPTEQDIAKKAKIKNLLNNGEQS